MGIRIVLLGCCLLLQGCVTFLASNMGASATVISTAETIDTVKTSADVVSVGATNKTITDHVMSWALTKDCRMFNVFEDKKICVELPPEMPNVSTKAKIIDFQHRYMNMYPATGRIDDKTRLKLWRIQHGLEKYTPPNKR